MIYLSFMAMLNVAGWVMSLFDGSEATLRMQWYVAVQIWFVAIFFYGRKDG